MNLNGVYTCCSSKILWESDDLFMDPKVENIELEESSISSVYIFDVEGNRIETNRKFIQRKN